MLANRPSNRAGLVLGLIVLALALPTRDVQSQARPRPLPHLAYERLDSLEQAALTGATFDDRLHAVSTITSIGLGQGDCVRGPAPTTIKFPGLVSRLATIYRRSDDVTLRHVILDRMLWQAECEAATAFLTEAVEDAPSAPQPVGMSDDLRSSPQSHAVDVLVAFGVRGEPALRRLHAQATVRDSSARANLEALSRRGFRRLR